MTTYQQLLVFRTCLAILVVLKKIIWSNQHIDNKNAENLKSIIKDINDEVNRLYKLNDKETN